MAVICGGFYTSRFVEAYTEAAAKEIALEEFIAEQKWKEVLCGLKNPIENPPRLNVADEVEELASFDDVTNPRPGYALYKED